MLEFLDDLIWGKVLVFVLVAIGLTFTVVSRFVQFRYFARMFQVFRHVFRHEKNHLNSFQALTLSVAGRVGSGNIIGVAAAITLGGPGAIFWMWVIGIMGMATSFFECSLAQLYKSFERDGTYRGGPAYYIQKGLGRKWMAGVFSILLLITFGFGFTAVQSYTVATAFEESFGIAPQLTGTVLTVILGTVIFGGVKRLSLVANVVVPIMASGYILIALLVIVANFAEIPAVLGLIVRNAFGLDSAFGGGVGAALLFGVKRGLFSNEAGLGSAPNVAAIAFVTHPVQQGVVQAFSVFIDTLIICSCTAFIILLSDVYQSGADGSGGLALTQLSLASHVGEWGSAFVSIALMFFAFSSILYNYYLGENSINFFSEENPIAFCVFRVLLLALAMWGSVQDLSTVFAFADLTMGLLAMVNLVAIMLLYKVGLRLMNDFDAQVRRGVRYPVLDPTDYADLNLDERVWPSGKSP